MSDITQKELQMMAQQKRSAAEADSLLDGIRGIVLDVEGTTTPITFLKDILSDENIEDCLKDTFEEPETIKDIAALRELSQKDIESSVEGIVPIPAADDGQEAVTKAVVANVQCWLDKKPDSAELKQFMLHVMRHGFESEADKSKGESDKSKGDYVFDDVPPMLRMLSEENFQIYIYSSQSLEFQKLLFTNTVEGDITDVISNFFDTSIGPKTETESYKKIATEIQMEPKEILYLTDLPEEAEAAVKAGCRSALVIRSGNADLTDEHLQRFACIEQLDELYGDEDEEDFKRLHGDDNGEPEDDEEDDENEDEVDEEEEGEEEEGEGEDA